MKKQYIISAILLGLFAATKAPFLAILIVLTCVTYLLLTQQKKELKKYFLVLPISLLVYLACYSMYFVYGHSFKEFLSLQKWIISFYSSGTKPPFYGIVFPMLLTGTWYTWWGKVEYVQEWWFGWSLLFVSYFVFIFLLGRKIRYKIGKLGSLKDAPIVFPGLWVIFYLAFLVITPVWPRYLLLLLPFLYNLIVWVVLQSIARKNLR